jgi:hypothetical protein
MIHSSGGGLDQNSNNKHGYRTVLIVCLAVGNAQCHIRTLTTTNEKQNFTPEALKYSACYITYLVVAVHEFISRILVALFEIKTN